MNIHTILDLYDQPRPNVAGLIADGALFVFNHSGGKDSQMMLIDGLRRGIPREQMLVVHAPLGEVEWEGAQELAGQQAADAGVAFVLAPAVKTFLELVEHRFEHYPQHPSFPQAGNRQCTSDLKTGPIQREVRRYARANGFSVIITCMGLRAAESPRRAKAKVWTTNHKQSIAGRTWYEWLPIHHLSTAEVFAGIKAAGQEPHWAYAAGNERLSCVFCIMGSARDLRNGAIHRPALYAKYVALEQQTGYTMHMNRKTLPELTGLSIPEAYQLHILNAPNV